MQRVLSAITDLAAKVSNIDSSISTVEDSLKKEIQSNFGDVSSNLLETEQRLNANINEVEKRVIACVDAKFDEVNSRCDDLEMKVQQLQHESNKKSDQIKALEMKINIHNILLFNFKDSERDEDELLGCVISLCKNTLKVNVDNSDFEAVYRMGKKQEKKDRPVMVKLFSVKTKNDIIKARSTLKGTKIVISEDFPKEINDKRKELYPAMMAAKQQNKKAFIKVDKLMVDGKECSKEEVLELCRKRARPNETADEEKKNSNSQKISKSENNSYNLGSQRGSKVIAKGIAGVSGTSTARPSVVSSPKLNKKMQQTTLNSPNSGVFNFTHNPKA